MGKANKRAFPSPVLGVRQCNISLILKMIRGISVNPEQKISKSEIPANPSDLSGCDRKRTDGPFNTERTVRSLSITTTLNEQFAHNWRSPSTSVYYKGFPRRLVGQMECHSSTVFPRI